MAKFNPITYARRLKSAGISKEQADILAEELANTIDNNLATKDDLQNIEQRLDNKIDTVESVLAGKINTVDTKLNWLMTLVGFIGFLIAVINFFR